jgi:hypothetical protein
MRRKGEGMGGDCLLNLHKIIPINKFLPPINLFLNKQKSNPK